VLAEAGVAVNPGRDEVSGGCAGQGPLDVTFPAGCEAAVAPASLPARG